jgi:hypothetical protein
MISPAQAAPGTDHPKFQLLDFRRLCAVLFFESFFPLEVLMMRIQPYIPEA